MKFRNYTMQQITGQIWRSNTYWVLWMRLMQAFGNNDDWRYNCCELDTLDWSDIDNLTEDDIVRFDIATREFI